jgi:hypothetical protein
MDSTNKKDFEIGERVSFFIMSKGVEVLLIGRILHVCTLGCLIVLEDKLKSTFYRRKEKINHLSPTLKQRMEGER